MGDDIDDSAKFLDVDFANIFVIRVDNLLHYVSLTSVYLPVAKQFHTFEKP